MKSKSPVPVDMPVSDESVIETLNLDERRKKREELKEFFNRNYALETPEEV